MKYFVRCMKNRKYEKIFTIGKVYEVTERGIVADDGTRFSAFTHGGNYDIHALNKWFKSCEYEFELVDGEKIVITREGKTTIATLYRGDEKVVATTRCAPEDKFDFMVGAKIALNRLEAEINKPKYYNGKVVCIKTAYPNGWSVGKVYEVKDGVITTNFGRQLPTFGERYRDAEDVRHAGYDPALADTRHNPRNEFVPLIEE